MAERWRKFSSLGRITLCHQESFSFFDIPGLAGSHHGRGDQLALLGAFESAHGAIEIDSAALRSQACRGERAIPCPALSISVAMWRYHVVAAVHRTYALYHHNGVQGLPLTSIAGAQTLVHRLLVGLPLCLAVKAVAKELAIRILPSMCNVLGVQIRSTAYIKAIHMDDISLKEKTKTKEGDAQETVDSRRSNYLLRILQAFEDEVLDVDSGIRAVQYAGIGWSIFELAPQVYSYFKL